MRTKLLGPIGCCRWRKDWREGDYWQMIVVLERYHDDSNLNGALLDTDLADPNYIGTIVSCCTRI